MPAVIVRPTGHAILTLDAALDECCAGIVLDGMVIAVQRQQGRRGTASLPAMAAAVMQEAGLDAGALAGVAVTVGPGSFTGVRAALSLAHGIGLGAEVPVWGVTVGAALRVEAVQSAGNSGRPVWVAIDSKRGRVFLDDGSRLITVALDALPEPGGAVALAGDAAIAVASRLAARGFDVQLLAGRVPGPLGVAGGPRVAALPLYVDPPEARPVAATRPAPI